MRTRRLTAVLVAVAALVAGCGYAPTPLPAPPTPSAMSGGSTAAPSQAPQCDDALQSYAPQGAVPAPGRMPSGSTMKTIQDRGRLVAGVSADTYLFASRNPLSGRIEGFDIDLVDAVAAAIFGTAKGHVQLRVITAADRLPLLESGEVDVVVRTMTITCDRWTRIAFSGEYYRAGQKLLVKEGSDVTGLADLAGVRVCAPSGTSSLSTLRARAPQAVAVPAANHTGCLALFQQGEVDAITGDDTVLAGLAAQDPYATVVGDAFTAEPYGIGVNADRVDLVRFVNGVLETRRTDGSWTADYDRWLADTLGPAPKPPVLRYGRTR
ncbi:glutamate ABC transporter substrate-binding protein [Phycicoccus flavus]|uniref:Glutamate ABC transporter substrate-binding protein n=1 Tax=Phycicoccus flavus TaxID=2502783 RepID=A0A8T6R9I4_9MICO|nr:glutamate ABC transporter substrate-binding protein [Phycicoccus flavus]NHA68891.1 glutamate ABC transporter substrate-binding protein [Phycicoccus flavus]